MDYVDLYLMHWPQSYVYHGDDVIFPHQGKAEVSDIDYLDTWKAMEELVTKGLTKSIGVSNFNSEQLKRIMENCKIKPIHNQLQSPRRYLCRLVTAYCPLGRPDPINKLPTYLYDSKVKAIADKYGKTPAQVVLRYVLELGTVPIPKSVTKTRIIENFNIFDFQLTTDDHKILDSFHTGERIIPMDESKHSKYYPFNIEF
uniref:NADP-dependent oxidoreductase domain-containing protein n=1 Tax=Glossina brevipalpis TaxID=37001 RepID=A0A1A9WTL2_9MUSC